MYQIDWNKLIEHTLPYLLRKVKQVAWLYTLIKPVRWLHDEFLAYRTQTRIDLLYTSQVIYLEKLLNDRFDETQRRIYIDDVERTTVYIGRNSDPDPLYVGKKDELPYVYVGRSEDYESEHDYRINVPDALPVNEVLIRALVDRYNQAGKAYYIRYYV